MAPTPAGEGELTLRLHTGQAPDPLTDERAWANGGPINLKTNWVFGVPLTRAEIREAGLLGRNLWEEARRTLIAHAGVFLPPNTPFEIRQTLPFKDPTDPELRICERLGWAYEPVMLDMANANRWKLQEWTHESRRWAPAKGVWVWGRYVAKPAGGVN